ncbi:DNA-binding CsgD family transcriptional regulator [Novosphingobium kunmingense]|uniref:DNA-binding CsgD family transcriptional regulator n=1 Tax=Novosphingobium kunmingense TaxID=1211806 RepID=A0A2N0I4B1_9SPHN|nr:sigma factor-like helix-turn-helix DNA-binding protein [Novosphingobium kunmingense]PKB26019.1 DNA-binding CsgD family transcriptional regulator [Novosphingobium kunmingense]
MSDNILNERQIEIIEGLQRHHSIKEIARLIGMSPSNVNKHISKIKSVLGAQTHREIILNYENLAGPVGGTKTAGTFSHLPNDMPPEAKPGPNEAGLLHFADAGAFSGQAWANVFEPRIVPRWLDGDHYVLARLGAIVGLLLLMLVLPVLGVAALDSIAAILNQGPSLAR